MKIGKYNYPNDIAETLKIDKRIKDDFKVFCKEKKIIKSKLIEKFYKTILIRWRDGSLDASQGNLTIKILDGCLRGKTYKDNNS